MPPETSAGIVVFHKEGNKLQYLLLHYEEGHWDLPKGHVEGSEKLEETAKRETIEETGLKPEIVQGFKEKISYFFRNRQGAVIQKTVHFFLGLSDKNEVTLSDEHIGYAWLSYENAVEKLTYGTAKEILIKANEFLVQKKLDQF